jgi:hypothetical protein
MSEVPQSEIDGNLDRSAGPWLPKESGHSLLIMGQDGGVIAEFYSCMGRGKANRDFCLKAVAALISGSLPPRDDGESW